MTIQYDFANFLDAAAFAFETARGGYYASITRNAGVWSVSYSVGVPGE